MPSSNRFTAHLRVGFLEDRTIRGTNLGHWFQAAAARVVIVQHDQLMTSDAVEKRQGTSRLDTTLQVQFRCDTAKLYPQMDKPACCRSSLARDLTTLLARSPSPCPAVPTGRTGPLLKSVSVASRPPSQVACRCLRGHLEVIWIRVPLQSFSSIAAIVFRFLSEALCCRNSAHCCTRVLQVTSACCSGL